MPQRAVRQPNGRFAVWSTVVDHFVAVGLTDWQAVEWFKDRQWLSEAEARGKLERAERDEATDGPPCCDQVGLRRWHDCLATILHVHGTAALAKFFAEHADDVCDL